MPTTIEEKNIARQRARAVLAQSAQFRTLPPAEQFNTYQRLVRENVNQLAPQRALPAQSSLARQMFTDRASDLIDDKRHENRRIEQAGQLAGDFVQQVDFPKFVRDLLKGVFDANLEVTLAQMDKYIELLKAATASLSKFINAIDDAASFGYLAENQSDDFSMGFDEEDKDDSGQPKVTLTDKEGNKVDLTDNAIKAKIMDAKIAMAKEQRALLRETILMGISRLVVERGNVKASVLFDFKASEKIDKADKAAVSRLRSTSHSSRASGGLLGSIFGGPEAGTTVSTRDTQISVSSAKSEASTSLAAKLTGSVDITFKSDYFKLDNFASMYADIRNQAPSVAGGAPATAAAPGAPVSAPAPAAAIAAPAPVPG
jgi:hypothetical protein